jgi:hypothetical protein
MQTPTATAYRVETYCGTVDGWRAVSPAVVDAVTAARRLRLYNAVRGDARLFRVAAA